MLQSYVLNVNVTNRGVKDVKTLRKCESIVER